MVRWRTVAKVLSMGLVTGMRCLGANVPAAVLYIVAYGATIGTEAPGARSASRPMNTMSREEAYRRCRGNRGAPGVDDVTFPQIETEGRERWLENAREELMSGHYRPQHLLRVCPCPRRPVCSERFRSMARRTGDQFGERQASGAGPWAERRSAARARKSRYLKSLSSSPAKACRLTTK
ncbi:hypothetical protein GGD64_008080 [Bradyrhizobium sp. CIR3A]|nr:hypothetical protein [Bradyrhizobium sp. CIR3A]